MEETYLEPEQRDEKKIRDTNEFLRRHESSLINIMSVYLNHERSFGITKNNLETILERVFQAIHVMKTVTIPSYNDVFFENE